ncbi:MAG: D-glycero-beta-D-manno-heptose 1-phosphate adenylyltransferase [Bacteroidales bacterium]|nr:D-glycero-beta-D-manno-heptose 1-phosphate adenylyltransferase [Bacteroidales bacterium]
MKNLDIVRSKIFTFKSLAQQLGKWRALKKSIVFTNGCFDIIHLGHIDYLSKSADEGDILIIGLNTDGSVRKLKGRNRPVIEERSRSFILASLHFVDAVVLFDEETPFKLIKLVQPDVLIKGSDYPVNEIIGSDIVLNKGGEVKTIDFLPGYSTTDIINKINNLNN